MARMFDSNVVTRDPNRFRTYSPKLNLISPE
jgi:hypothetical protein